MKPHIFVVQPIRTGSDWMEPAAPIIVNGHSSKRAAIKAVRNAGWMVMHRGGLIEASYIQVIHFFRSTPGTTREQEYDRETYRSLKRLGLSDEDEVLVWTVTVHP
jgi:hypothetical protein